MSSQVSIIFSLQEHGAKEDPPVRAEFQRKDERESYARHLISEVESDHSMHKDTYAGMPVHTLRYR